MQLQFDLSELAKMTKVINKALSTFEGGEVLEAVAPVLESQTRRRIESEKTGPDGTRWPAWSESHARTRHENQNLLVGSGDLLESIRGEVNGDAAEVGSNMIYAAAHQFGLDMSIRSNKRRVVIPARPFLGISSENEMEITDVVNDLLNRRMR